MKAMLFHSRHCHNTIVLNANAKKPTKSLTGKFVLKLPPKNCSERKIWMRNLFLHVFFSCSPKRMFQCALNWKTFAHTSYAMLYFNASKFRFFFFEYYIKFSREACKTNIFAQFIIAVWKTYDIEHASRVHIKLKESKDAEFNGLCLFLETINAYRHWQNPIHNTDTIFFGAKLSSWI